MTHLLYVLSTSLALSMCTTSPNNSSPKVEEVSSEQGFEATQNETYAVFASGCFWCVEAVFESVEGVSEAVSGYAGDKASNATYEKVSSGRTKHAEAVKVFYNPEVVSYETLLEVFFGSQDPTTLNQQGPDRGTQYRSTIFYRSEAEKISSETYIAKLTDQKVFDGKITTTLEPLIEFFDAEEYHQDFEARNPDQPYVRGVSVPRLNKFKAKYPQLLKSNLKLKH